MVVGQTYELKQCHLDIMTIAMKSITAIMYVESNIYVSCICYPVAVMMMLYL